MNLRHLIFALLLVSSISYADEPKHTEISIVEDGDKSNRIYDLATLEHNPEFPGGNDGLMRFLCENVRYPDAWAESTIQGIVLVKFTIFKDGSVGNVEVVKPLEQSADVEAVRVVSALPKWRPGILNGEPVNVWYTLPIRFQLQAQVQENNSPLEK